MSVPQSSLARLAVAFNPANFYRSVVVALRLVVGKRQLIVAMARRDLQMRYAGQLSGNFWIIGHPLLQMLLFVFIFGIVFKQKIGGTVDLPRDYTTYMLSGLVPWLAISPALSSGCLSIVSNTNIVKQFTFETELLPVKDVVISMVFWFVGIAILAVYGLIVDHSLPATYVLLPVVLAMHLMLMVGLAWGLSAITVFFRDLKDIVVVLTTLGVYVLPIVYLPDWVPAAFKPVIYANPFSAIIWVYQDVLYFGHIEHPLSWVVFIIFALCAFAVGFRLFSRLKPMFGTVL